VHDISNKYNLKNVCEVTLTVFVVKIACNANKSTLSKKVWADIQHAQKIMINEYKILVCHSEGKKPLWKLRHR